MNKLNKRRAARKLPKLTEPLTYADIGVDKPRSTSQIMHGIELSGDSAKHGGAPVICKVCGKSGGTLTGNKIDGYRHQTC
jgi:hypothetical protein